MQAGEDCDDGNTEDGDGCSAMCELEVCGDGVLQEGLGEECDDGNTMSGDGCSATCELETCGDGVVQEGLGEECDDGNTEDGDGCSATCKLEVCGDGVVQDDEECDDGNTEDGDGCSARCEWEPCGDIGTSVLGNPDFETGALAPWTTNGTAMVQDQAFRGDHAAEIEGSFHLTQALAEAVPVSSLTRARFWAWHDAADNPAMVVTWGYGDGTLGNYIVSAAELGGWVQLDLLPRFDQEKSLTYLRIFGYAGGGEEPDITRVDYVELCQ